MVFFCAPQSENKKANPKKSRPLLTYEKHLVQLYTKNIRKCNICRKKFCATFAQPFAH